MTRLDWHLVSWNSDLAGQLSLDPRDLRPQVAILVGQPLSEFPPTIKNLIGGFHRDLDHSVYFVLYDWGRKSVTKMTRINKFRKDCNSYGSLWGYFGVKDETWKRELVGYADALQLLKYVLRNCFLSWFIFRDQRNEKKVCSHLKM